MFTESIAHGLLSTIQNIRLLETQFAGKQPCRYIFFNKVAGLQLYYKGTPAQVFFFNFVTFLKTIFLQKTLGDCFNITLFPVLLHQK